MRIYLDHNASAPVRPEARQARTEADALGNPSSIHWAGRLARERLDAARERVAASLGATPPEVIFTSGGTEANALALWGSWLGRPDPARRRLLASAIEHPSTLATLRVLAGLGATVELLPVTRAGALDLDAARRSLGADVALVSCMLANNETGALQPVAELASLAHGAGALLHCDAVQAVGRVPVCPLEIGADCTSLSGHKFGAGPGAGVLLAGRGVPLGAVAAGHQELGRRAGTEDVPACAALAAALEAAERERPAMAARVGSLRERLEAGLRALPGVAIASENALRLCNTVNALFEGASGEALLIALDLEGVAASSGAACASGTLEPSHVLLAMGFSRQAARGSLRFSLGTETTVAEIDTVLAKLPPLLAAARAADAPLSV